MKKIIIIGAGLTGLHLAYLLKKQNIEAKLLEARDRIGGRIFTHREPNKAAIEMGATWLGLKHSALTQLLKELDIPIFEQMQGDLAIYESMSTSPPQLVRLPPNPQPSYRIAGGSDQLIHTLADFLSKEQIRLEHKVEQISFGDQICSVNTNKGAFEADIVISTLPPNLLINKVQITPELPNEVLQIAKKTHTWMGESIKVGFQFPKAFWQSERSSGTIFSNVGPVNEMYDHSNIENDQHALKGFLNGSFYISDKESRKKVVLNQLRKYYGQMVDENEGYQECIWRNEAFTFTPYEESILPHQNNSHPIYRQSLFNNRFFIAGSETAEQFGGYMDGAVRSANWVFQELIK